MKISDALEIRYSRRSYEDKPIEEQHIKKINDAIKKCNAMSGLHIQLITENKEAFKPKDYMFKNANNYIALVGKGDDISREKSGYFGEKLVLLATGLGLGTCWVGGKFDKFVCGIKINEGEMLHLVIAVGPVKKKITAREAMISSLLHIGGKDRKKVARSFGDVPSWFWGGVDAVLKAPSAFNRLPTIINCNDGEITASISGKKDYEYIDLGIAKLHFEIGALGGDWEWGNGGVFSKM